MREITHVIVHCTDSPDSAADIGVSDVDAWHKQNGWDCIGYHWLVNKSGGLEKGRAESRVGAHAKGYNANSIGIVWVGRDDCTQSQWEGLTNKISELSIAYNVKIENILGHNELPHVAKTCPNINMTKVRNLVQLLTGKYLDLKGDL